MRSIRDIYKIGKGPSSSHTMGPARAAELFKSENPDADSFKVILYGSLAKTGMGHGTDIAIKESFEPKECEVELNLDESIKLKHPNTLDLIAIKDGKEVNQIRVRSIGGGDIVIEGRPKSSLLGEETYLENSFAEIKQFCEFLYVGLVDYI